MLSDLWIGFVVGVFTMFALTVIVAALISTPTGKQVLSFLGLSDEADAPIPSQEEE